MKGFLSLRPKRTNDKQVRRWVIASYGFPSGYWRWALYYTAPQFRRLRPAYAWGWKYGYASFYLPILGGLSLYTQHRLESMEH